MYNRFGRMAGEFAKNFATDILEKFTVDMTPAQRLGDACRVELANDPNVKMLVANVKMKYGVPGELSIIPLFEEGTLMIRGYGLCCGKNLVVGESNFKALQNKLISYSVSDEESVQRDILNRLKEAYNNR
jgi:hypothetical protein